jgi:hypothetical protein
MNKQQKEAFVAEESNFREKQAGCLLILGVVALEIAAVAVGTSYYLSHQNKEVVPEPEKVVAHTNLSPKSCEEHSR